MKYAILVRHAPHQGNVESPEDLELMRRSGVAVAAFLEGISITRAISTPMQRGLGSLIPFMAGFGAANTPISTTNGLGEIGVDPGDAHQAKEEHRPLEDIMLESSRGRVALAARGVIGAHQMLHGMSGIGAGEAVIGCGHSPGLEAMTWVMCGKDIPQDGPFVPDFRYARSSVAVFTFEDDGTFVDIKYLGVPGAITDDAASQELAASGIGRG